MDPSIRFVLKGCEEKCVTVPKNYFIFRNGTSFIKSWRIKKIFIEPSSDDALNIVFWNKTPNGAKIEKTIKVLEDVDFIIEDIAKIKNEFPYLLFLTPLSAIDRENLIVNAVVKKSDFIEIHLEETEPIKLTDKYFSFLKKRGIEDISSFERTMTINEIIEKQISNSHE